MDAADYRCGDFRVDVGNRRFLHLGREIALEPRVFAVIAQLLRRPGELLTRNELLDAVWGHRYVTPSTLNRIIALARRAFGDEVAEPRFIQTVHGAGYRYVGPWQKPQLEERPAQARFGPPFAARLPARIDELIGRDAELAALATLLLQQRAITVIGAGGMGKTQCALEAARQASALFPDGVWFFDLSALAHAGEWLSMLAGALDIRVPTGETLNQVCRTLQERQALLFLDNCDRIATDIGALVIQLLRATSALKVLATSRRPLNFAGEQLVRMPPLESPPPSLVPALTPERVSQYPAVRLLIKRIRSVRADLSIDALNAASLCAICHTLDGMPLALELAAPRFALLSPDQVLERLVQRFRFLESDSAGRDERHRSLRSLLEWSYALMSAGEQKLLNWTAVFVHSWSAEALVTLAVALGLEAESAIDLLSGLVSHSLVSVVTDVMPPRYRLLETVREYALVQLRGCGQETAARAAHLEAIAHVCQIARQATLGGRMREKVEQLILDSGNIQAAIETAAACGTDHPLGLDILGSILLHAKGHGDYLSVLHWCRAVLGPSPGPETAERARALLTLGVVQIHMAMDVWLPDALPEAARIARRSGDWWTEAYAHSYCALGLTNDGRPDEAEQHAHRAHRIASEHNDELLLGLTGLARAWIHLARNQPIGALAELSVARTLGPDLHQRHFINVYIGLAQFALGSPVEAARHWLAGLNLSIAVSNVRGTAGSMEGCAYLACQAGEWRAAAKLLAAAAGIRARTRVPIFAFWRIHQAFALQTLRTQLTEAEFAAASQAGQALRQEDAANEALALLERYAQASPAGSAQEDAKRPVGS